jgi:NitT/TauT family transport system substrate-binding protein
VLVTLLTLEQMEIDMKFIRTTTIAVLAGLIATTAHAGENVKIAWTHYTGWEPWGYIEHEGIAQKKIEQTCGKGSSVKIEMLNDYAESLNLYTSGAYDGVAATNMDALIVPAVGGVKSDMLVVSDYSDGNDAIITKNPAIKGVADLKGQQINLVDNSVSAYLLSRAVSMKGVKEKDLKMVNTSDADIGSLYTSQKNATVVTWNPIVMAIKHGDANANVLFTSKDVPGEIIDAMVVKSSMPACAKAAIQDAWFETVGKLKNGDAKMIEFLASQAGGSVAEFKEQMGTTHFFWTRADADAFVKSGTLKETMDYVRRFSFDHGLYNGKAVDAVGIKFTDGFVMGDKNNANITFVPQK